jgi:hypothetical protein
MSAMLFGVRGPGRKTYLARAEFNRDALGDGVDRYHFKGRRKSSTLVDDIHKSHKLAGMSARLFDKGRNSFLTAGVSWTGDVQKAILVDCTTSTGAAMKLVTGATNASPVVYTVTANGFSNNDVVVIGGILGNLSANQIGLVTAQATNTIDLTTLEGGTIAGSGAYTSGGYAFDLTLAQFVSDILGTRIGTDPTVAGTSASKGIANATSPITWSTVPSGNPGQAIFLYDNAGGSDSTNHLIAFQDGKVRVITVGDTPAASTTMKVQPLKGQLWDGATGSAPVIAFSNGKTATLNASAAQGADSITVTSTANDIPDASTAEVTVFGSGLPVTPSGGNISFNIGSIYYPLTPTGLFVL